MPQRSAVTQLPDEVKEDLNRRLIKSGFANYQGLADWLTEQGYEISKSSIHRHGQQLERRLQAIKISTEGARAIANASPDDEGAMGDALTRLMQDKIFTLLIEMEEIDADDVDVTKLGRMIADLNRASVAQKRWKGEVKHMSDLPDNVDRPALFLENLEFIVGALKETDPEGLKILARNFDGIVDRFKERHAKAS